MEILVNRRNLNSFEAYHEIGHAIVGYIFNDYVLSLQKIILNPEDILNIGGNPNDLAYTHNKRSKDFAKQVEENEHLAALVMGLNFLGGIGGATYLFPDQLPGKVVVTQENFMIVLNTEGSKGDFEFIENEEKLYGWFIFKKNGFNINSAYLIHARLMNVIQDIFLKPEIRDGAKTIFKMMESNPNTNIELEVFKKTFPDELILKLRANLETSLAANNFPLL